MSTANLTVLHLQSPTPEQRAVFIDALPAGWSYVCLDSCGNDEIKLCTADAIVTVDVPLTKSMIAAAKNLRCVVAQGVGHDHIDVDALRQRKIPLFACAAGVAQEAAEHSIFLMLATLRQATRIHCEIARGEWPGRRYQHLARTLTGRVVGLVGFGRIAQALSTRLLAFGCAIRVFRPTNKTLPKEWRMAGVTLVTELDELVASSDVISLHLPLTAYSRHLIDRRRIALMQPHAVIINTARGALLEEQALVEALQTRAIAGAGLDVFEQEPLPVDSPLRKLLNVTLTSHVATCTIDALRAKADAIYTIIQSHLTGELVEGLVINE